MSKNLSIHKLILYLTLFLVFTFVIAALTWNYLNDLINPYSALVVAVIFFGMSVYFVMKYVLNHFLYRRIKLIYKLIRSSKVSMSENELDTKSNADNLERVEHEVRHYVTKQQEQIESLKELENYRKNFLGNISHELKTPIFSVQGYIHTLLDGGIRDDQVNRRFLKKAAHNIERLETIVNDLEIIAKLENATLELELQPFNIKALVEEVFEELEVQSDRKDITFGFKNGAGNSYTVYADREYVQTVLINLMVNSIKYGKEGGRTLVGFYELDDDVLIEVSDNGIGIEKNHLKHLFDRFYRVDKSRSREGGGSGLGLSIVKHIIEAHEQTINVRSTPQLGTTMSFTLKKAEL